MTSSLLFSYLNQLGQVPDLGWKLEPSLHLLSRGPLHFGPPKNGWRVKDGLHFMRYALRYLFPLHHTQSSDKLSFLVYLSPFSAHSELTLYAFSQTDSDQY
jgi:hypothetical protein